MKKNGRNEKKTAIYLSVPKKNYTFASENKQNDKKREDMNIESASFGFYYYFYFARNCEAGSCV